MFNEIKKLLAEKLTIGKGAITADNAIILNSKKDLSKLPAKSGMYVILSTMTKADLDRNQASAILDKTIEINGETYIVIYNGKSKSSVRGRINSHLFRKDLHGGTSGIAMNSVTNEEFDGIREKIGKGDKIDAYFKKGGKGRYLNGVNIETDEKLKNFKFAVISLECEPMFREAFEEIFRNENGHPPYCQYK